MTTYVTPRQPFAALDASRLQTLTSAKNRQNAISATLSSALKPSQSGSTKRRYSPSSFEDEEDSENIDPSFFNSPTKRSKTSDGLCKPSQFTLTTSQSVRASPLSISDRITSTPSSMPSVRKILTSPCSTSSTPISTSRGSPKHKRIGILSKRRTSSSPFRRVDPPSFSRNSSPAGLPFSIDAALSGTIPSYTPKPAAVPTLEEAMPKSWFFDIHEDTPEQEATNLMEHSACTLDISSDDDCETKRRNEELERGKENIPPSDLCITAQLTASAASASANPDRMDTAETGQDASHIEHVKFPKLKRALTQDAMDQDRSPLSDLPAADYYGPGLDAGSYVTVDAAIERPSGLSKEFDFTVPPAQEDDEEGEEGAKVEVSEQASEQKSSEVSEKEEVPIYGNQSFEAESRKTCVATEQPDNVVTDEVKMTESL